MKPLSVSSAVAALLLFAAPEHGLAGPDREWHTERIAGPGTVVSIRQAGQDGYVRTAKGWHRPAICGTKICLKPARPPSRQRASKGLPDGWIVQTSGKGLVRAWYGEPTDRYGHGILGDAIEAGTVVAEDSTGNGYRLRLPKTAVFEDLTPRLADLDGDGHAEIITIKSTLRGGGSLAVYGRKGKHLREVAATTPIGTPNRWLNVAGIADFNGSGTKDIAIVITPHIGGTLEIWSYGADGLKRTAAMSGFSNHAIGSRNLDLSVVADADGDGIADLALPDAARRALKIVAVKGKRISTLATIQLPEEIVHNMTWVAGSSGPVYLLGLRNGSLVAVRRSIMSADPLARARSL